MIIFHNYAYLDKQVDSTANDDDCIDLDDSRSEVDSVDAELNLDDYCGSDAEFSDDAIREILGQSDAEIGDITIDDDLSNMSIH